jgi:cytochrome c-type biogenesis protein
MLEFLSWLGKLIKGAPAVALAAAFVWGILSVVLSPCHLASIPLIVGFIDKQGKTTTRRAFAISLLFSVGILITIAVIGTVTALAGREYGDLGPWATYGMAVIFFLVGLNLMDVLPTPFSGPGQVNIKRKGLLAAFILGLVFGVALGPCTFAYMAPMLAVTVKLASTQMLYGMLLLAVYGVGHCAVIVLAGTSTGLVQKYLNWNEKSKGAVIVKRVCGGLVILGGLYLLYLA